MPQDARYEVTNVTPKEESVWQLVLYSDTGHDLEFEGNQKENQSTRLPGIGACFPSCCRLYNSETWIMIRLDEQVFEMAVLRKIGGVGPYMLEGQIQK